MAYGVFRRYRSPRRIQTWIGTKEVAGATITIGATIDVASTVTADVTVARSIEAFIDVLALVQASPTISTAGTVTIAAAVNVTATVSADVTVARSIEAFIDVLALVQASPTVSSPVVIRRFMIRRTSAAPTGGEIGALYVSPTGSDATGTGLFEAPYATITKARDVVRTMNDSMTADIHVYLRGGRYPLTSTAVFDLQDSGSNGFSVIYKAYPGEQPRLSGGTLLTGWSDAGGGIWTTAVSTLRFRQLYVNGVRCWRARNPNRGSYGSLTSWDLGGERVEVTATHLGTPARLTGVEVCILGRGGNHCSLRVASVSGTGGTRFITPQEPEQTRIFQQVYPPKDNGRAYWLENALEYLTDQGEFYINTDTNVVHYMKRTAENLSTAEVMAPALERLIQVQGTLGAPVHHIQFFGLIFEHATWLTPNSEGFVGDQACTYSISTLPPDQITSYPSARHPAAVYLESAHDVRFERCIFRHCGSDAIDLYRDCDDCQLIGNVVTDISAGGIGVDLNLEGNPADASRLCERVTIQNNYITQVGQDYFQASAIFTGYVIDPVIEHNEIDDINYTGITVGWGWADVENDMSGAMVRFNAVSDALKMLADGGGIYTLSRQDGALVDANWIHDFTRGSHHGIYGINGIFHDEGTGQITTSNNVIQGMPVGGDDGNIRENNVGAGITYSNNAGTSSTTIANAGLETAYDDIKLLV